MTVSSQQSYVEYNADGSTTTFTVPFYFLQGSDLGVTIRYSDNTTIDLTYGVNFSASGAGNPAGGSVTLNAAYPAGNKVLILRAPPATQETQYAENGKFPAKSHEKALDKLTMLIQQWGYWWDNLALKKPNFFASYYDAKQNRIANLADPTGANDAVNFKTLLNMTDGGASDAILSLLGDTSNPTSGDALIGVKQPLFWSVGRTQHEVNAERISVKDFGAKGDGVTDDTVALTNAITECAKAGIKLTWPAGTYLATRFKVSGDNYVYNWAAEGKVILKSTATTPLGPNWIDDYFIRLEGGTASLINYSTTINPGDTTVVISAGYTLDVDDVLMIQGNRLIQTDNRGQACEGEMHLVKSFNTTTRAAELTGTAYFFYSATADYTTAVTAAASGAEFTLGSDTVLNAQYNQVKITGVTGANAGVSRYITHWNNTTKTAKFEYLQGPFPSTPAVGDTFRVTRRADLYKRKPCYGQITGEFRLERPVTYNATAGNLGFRGLVIDGAVGMTIENISVSGFSETGIFLESCYRTSVLNPYVEYANRGFNIFDGTGYGVEVYNCSHCNVENLEAFACRRGIDVSGTQMVSLYNTIINPCVLGGGIAYDGVKFFPGGATRNSCCGGHGPSYETTFTGGNSTNLYYASVIRGLNEVYDGMVSRGFSGPAPHFIQYSGGGFTIQNCSYIDSFTEESLPSNLRYKPVPAAQRDNRPLTFVDMTVAQTDENSYYKELPVVIKGNTARAVTKGFFRFDVTDSLAPPVQNLYFGGNLCIANPETSTSSTGVADAVMVYSSAPGAQIARNFYDLGGNRLVPAGAGYASCGMFDTPANIAGTIVQPDGKWLITIAPGKASSIQISGYVPNIRLTLHDLTRLQFGPAGAEIMLHRGEAVDYSPIQASNKRLITLQTGVLTDGSGTVDNLNISFDNATVYFSNRTANSLTISVSISGI